MMTPMVRRIIFLEICCVIGIIVFNSFITEQTVFETDIINISTKNNKVRTTTAKTTVAHWSFTNQSGISLKTATPSVNVEAQWDLFSLGWPTHLDCKRLAVGDKVALKDYLSIGRVVVSQDPDFPMDCESIQRRLDSSSHTQYPKDIPYAIAANVYEEYLIIEIILGITYSSKNSYCYALDQKSSPKFKFKIRRLSECIENVHVLKEEYAFNSKGHFQDHAHFRCTQELLNKGNWSYILYNQNHDIVIRTNSEISQIIRYLNGSQVNGYEAPRIDRYDTKKNWTARDLHLYKNETSRSKAQLDTPIKVIKSPNQVFLSREFVTALDAELNMSSIIEAFNVPKYYGTDEMLFATLGLAYHLGLPGQASPLCLNGKQIMRYVKWCYIKDPLKCCFTKHGKHWVCYLTIEYLPDILKNPGIIANKVHADSDIGVLLCLREELRERSRNPTVDDKMRQYKELFTVRERELRFNGTFNQTNFKC